MQCSIENWTIIYERKYNSANINITIKHKSEIRLVPSD